MNDTEILTLVYELKDKIENSDIYKELKKNEEQMMKNEDCLKLFFAYQNIQEEYNQAKRFEKYGSDVEDVQKRLYEMKLKVDSNELVKKYNESYKLVKKELKNIENVLFKDVVKVKKIREII